MKKSISILMTLFLGCVAAFAQPKIQLTDFASGFNRPVDIAHCKDSRLFVVEQRGKIWIVDSAGAKLTPAFLEIDARVYDSGNEQGLLGLAFHPNYAQNNFFYVYYIQNNGDTKVSRFTRDSINVNKADPNSEKVILEQDQPFSNHNGGSLKFGLDGFLYIGLGDGGSAGDPQSNGQKKNTFLSKILRIDIDNGDPYAVPTSNPFVADASFKPETWTWGLRNPWRISFDRLTGDLWIGDVGQNARNRFSACGCGRLQFRLALL
jgi:glucose/arabinose dehydrogenase